MHSWFVSNGLQNKSKKVCHLGIPPPAAKPLFHVLLGPLFRTETTFWLSTIYQSRTEMTFWFGCVPSTNFHQFEFELLVQWQSSCFIPFQVHFLGLFRSASTSLPSISECLCLTGNPRCALSMYKAQPCTFRIPCLIYFLVHCVTAPHCAPPASLLNCSKQCSAVCACFAMFCTVDTTYVNHTPHLGSSTET